MCVASLLVAAIVLVVAQLIGLPFSPLAFGLCVAILLLVVALAAVLYWSVASLGLCYRLTRNGIVIAWGASQLVIPIEDVVSIVPVSQADATLGIAAACRRRAWLGGWARRMRLNDGRVACLRTAAPLDRSLVILTPKYAYIVSPDRPATFVHGWQERQLLGPTQSWREEEKRTWLLGLPIWNDHVTWGLMGGAVVTALVLQGFMASVYDRLPTVLALHFDAYGQPDRIGDRGEILRLPVIALLMLMLDLGLGLAVYRRDRVAAYLIWGGGIVVQMLAWGAVYTLTA
jgi:Domain of unknown function (DUF1648)/Bacterial PH domain